MKKKSNSNILFKCKLHQMVPAKQIISAFLKQFWVLSVRPLSTGPTNATINRCYLVCYRGGVLSYAHSDQFSPLRILSCCYYYLLICILCVPMGYQTLGMICVSTMHTTDVPSQRPCSGEGLDLSSFCEILRVRLNSSS